MSIEIGNTYGRLTILSVTKEKGKKAMANCSCSCGGTHSAILNNIRYGITKSCGCLLSEVILL